MNIKTGQYWDQSWSPIRGCTHASEGCRNCWARRMHARNLPKLKSPTTGKAFAYRDARGEHWSERVELIESELIKPIHWRKPRIVALNWMGDLFHESLPDEAIDRVFAVMALCPQHRFLVLTKRAKRMREYVANRNAWLNLQLACGEITSAWRGRRKWNADTVRWPLSNVGLGVSCEDQQTADERICQAAGVSYFFKQWGKHLPISRTDGVHELPFGEYNPQTGYGFKRVGKKAAGRLLDGRTWDEMPGMLRGKVVGG